MYLVLSDTSVCARLKALLEQSGHLVGADGEWRRLSDDAQAVIVDLDHRGLDGVSVIRTVHQVNASVPIICTIRTVDKQRILAAIGSGACGCILQNELEERIFSAIDEAQSGGGPLSGAVARMLIEHHRDATSASQSKVLLSALSEGEKAIVRELALGLTYDQIASAHGISVNTVRGYIRALYEKLNVGTKTEAVIRAKELGWIQEPQPPL